MAFYFAYSSNLSRQQMAGRCPSARAAFRAVLHDHCLEFTHYSPKRGCGTADIVPRDGERVWGAVYDVTPADLEALDRFEGAAYGRVIITVHDDDGVKHVCTAYHVTAKRGVFEPSEGYLELIREGAAEWSLPETYQALLQNVTPAEDEDHDH